MQQALKIDVIETSKRVTEGCKLGYDGGYVPLQDVVGEWRNSNGQSDFSGCTLAVNIHSW